MKINRNVTFILAVVITAGVFFMAGACSAPDINANAPVINSLVAEHPTLYPLGNTVVTCSASSPVGVPLKYRWVCNDGTIIKDPAGNEAKVTYEAPKTYGDFHIMATVEDGNGNSTSQTVTVTVIVRDPSKCCR